MKRKIVYVVLALVIIGGLALVVREYQTKRPDLHVYTWADYVKPELIQRFEKENNCRVIIDTFDSNETMYSKLKAGATGYDVITPSSYMVRLMNQQDMIIPLDHAKLPNLKNVDPDYLKLSFDPEMNHSVPYAFSITGIAYLKSKVPDFKPSWTMFNRTDLKGRMTMLNDMRETIGAALKISGKSINSIDEKDLNAARDIVIGWKKNLAKFENEQYKVGLASGEFILVQGYSGDILQIQEENQDVTIAIPEEGTSVCFDDMVIPKTSQQVELAHKYINFMHDPEVAAQNTEFTKYLCPNKPSYAKLSRGITDNPAIFLKPEVLAKCEIIGDLGKDNVKYTKLWDQIKAAE